MWLLLPENSRKTDVRGSACETKPKERHQLAETIISCTVSTFLKRPRSRPLEDEPVAHTHALHRGSTKFTFSFTKTSPRFVTTMQDAIDLWVDRRCFKICFCKVCRATVIKGGMSPHILEKLTGDTRDYRQTSTISYHNFCCIGFSHYILRRNEEEPESLKHLCTLRYWMWLNCFAGTQSASCAMQMPR